MQAALLAYVSIYAFNCEQIVLVFMIINKAMSFSCLSA